MLVFPQLSSGGCAQYPFDRSRSRRNIRNTMGDGSVVIHPDSGAGTVRWSLPFNALSDEEGAAIQDLFDSSEGRLDRFIFVDPSANLLKWSEDFTKPPWQKDPALQIAAAIADPRGTTRASRLTNAGESTQRIRQSVTAPSSFMYCFSVYARSDGGSSLSLVRTAEVEASIPIVLDQRWKRILLSGRLTGTSSGNTTFSVELPAGAVVDLFGLQVEAQPGASVYMATSGAGGVYTARFDQDDLSFVAGAPGSKDTKIRIISADGD